MRDRSPRRSQLLLRAALSRALTVESSPSARWLGRLCLERRNVTLAEVREAVDAFAVLVEEPDAAEATLRRLSAS